MTTEERLAEIRHEYDIGEPDAYQHIPWLLDQLAERDARLAKLEAALETFMREYRGHGDWHYVARIATEAMNK